MQDIQGWDFQNGRHRIIREGACQKGPVRTVGELFEQRCADRLRESAANLSFDHAGMQNASTVMHSNITVDPNLTGDRVDLYTTKIKDKGMTQRGIDPILASRCRQFFGRPDRCFTNYGVHIVGQRSRSPMAGRGDTRKGYAGFRVAIQMYAPSGKDDIFRPAVQLPRSDPARGDGAVCRRQVALPKEWRLQTGWNSCRRRWTRHPWRYQIRQQP